MHRFFACVVHFARDARSAAAAAMGSYEQQRGASSKSDEVIGLLEEETEALISAHYRTPGGKESDDEAD